jgi:hypothetical protein
MHFFKIFLLSISLTVLSFSTMKKPDFSSLVNEFMDEQNSLKKIINLSGRQRMLTQNMSKLILLIQLNVKKEKSIEELKTLSSLYHTTLMAFKNGDDELGVPKATNPSVVEQIVKVEASWKVFYGHIQNIIDGKDTGKSFKYIMANNVNLLKISNELVQKYEKSNTSDNYLEKSRLRVVNIAGRQRMLTQKMTKEKLLYLRGSKEAKDDLLKTIKLFDESLTALILGNKEKMITKATNPKITKQLAVVEALWKRLKPLYEKEKNSSKEMAFIITKNTVLLKEMNSMVKMSEVEVEY